MKSGFDLTELALQLVMLLTWLCTFQRFTKILSWRGAGCEAGGSNGGGRGASSRKGFVAEAKARATPAGVPSKVRVKSRPQCSRTMRSWWINDQHSESLESTNFELAKNFAAVHESGSMGSAKDLDTAKAETASTRR